MFSVIYVACVHYPPCFILQFYMLDIFSNQQMQCSLLHFCYIWEDGKTYSDTDLSRTGKTSNKFSPSLTFFELTTCYWMTLKDKILHCQRSWSLNLFFVEFWAPIDSWIVASGSGYIHCCFLGRRVTISFDRIGLSVGPFINYVSFLRECDVWTVQCMHCRVFMRNIVLSMWNPDLMYSKNGCSHSRIRVVARNLNQLSSSSSFWESDTAKYESYKHWFSYKALLFWILTLSSSTII